jgi:large subunit ribosomal protein L24e
MVHKCSFCGEPLKPGFGKMIVSVTGKITYLCSSKCEKNWKMGRDPKKKKWTKIYKKE